MVQPPIKWPIKPALTVQKTDLGQDSGRKYAGIAEVGLNSGVIWLSVDNIRPDVELRLARFRNAMRLGHKLD